MKTFHKNTSVPVLDYKKLNKSDHFDYQFSDGTVHRFIVGQDGITRKVVDTLIREHNREAERNCYKDKPKMTKKYREQLEEYKINHYINDDEKGWTKHYQSLMDNVDNESSIDEYAIMLEAWENKYITLSEREKELLAVIEDLPEEDKVIINLYYYEEYSYREIGKMLGFSKDKVAGKLKKIHKKLANEMK